MEKSISSVFISWLPIVVMIGVGVFFVQKQRKTTGKCDKADQQETNPNRSDILPKLSKILGAVIILAVWGYLGFSRLGSQKAFENNQTENLKELNFKIISNESAKSIRIRYPAYSNEKSKCLTKQYQDEFMNIASKMPPAQFVGQHMDNFRSIVIDAGDSGKFTLDIQTRGRDVHADFTRFGDRSVATHYDGVTLYEWLQDLPSVALRECSADTGLH